ncbi:hypothetical protein B0H17DRAFT_1133021 [Mycena rosella]|uniref:MYND-type domain-containing protein n=1 Tax=Mycena rosella TaxID=1033263 RepID=A0AAD7DIP1_MYCRO|nr:hypothetical protein B0H17DRAFT_1133021 [Mycena rosella]
MKLIIDFQGNSATASLVSETPGVRAVIARAWGVYLNDERNVDEPGVADAIQFINRDTQSGHPPNIHEYTEGVGGLDRFAVCVLYHIDRVLRRPHGYPVSNTTVFLLKGLLRLLVESDDGQGPLATALLTSGIIGTITLVLCSFDASTLEGADDVRKRCFNLLTRRFDLSPSYPSLAESFKSNLVHAITTCAQNDLRMDDFLRTLLQRVLPRSLISHTVLSAIDRPVDKDTVLLFPQPDPFRDSELFQLWDRFNKTALRNVRILQAYNKAVSTSVLGCDNMKCEQIRRKNELMRCSSCRAIYYCSTACQALDWYEDGHRDVCSHLRNLRLEFAAEPETLSTRDRSFLHALVHYDYERTLRRSCVDKIGFIRQNPGEQFYLLFDYTRGFERPQVRPVGSPPDPNPSEGSATQWADQIARAARSGGRLNLVVVLVADGEHISRRMVPVRSPTSALHDGLSQIAGRITSGADLAAFTPRIMEDVSSLLRERKERGDHRPVWQRLVVPE